MRGTWMVVALAVACSGSSLPEMQVEEGSPEHRQLLQRQCDRGDATGCEGLGALMVADGEHAAARGLFQRACDGLSASGCYRLGELLDDERAGVVDAAGAAAATILACDGGHGPACVALGTRYLEGRGVPEDSSLAKQAWDKGCALGDTESCSRAAEVGGEE